MNIHPEAVKARHDSQQEMLHVIEAMMDGDAEDAQMHLSRWCDRSQDAMQLDRLQEVSNTSSPQVEEVTNLRSLLAECYDRLQYREHCGGLPFDIESRVQKALRQLGGINISK